ncbi:hypothetical protein JCM9279_006755 [Rhodotorula babjevae]
MGQLSPAAYDALLLEKVKLLIQAAMQSPRRRGPASTYEHFCESLDIRDEASLRAFEVLLYETTTRRPRKVRRPDPGPVASTSTATSAAATVQPRLRRLRRVTSSSSDDQLAVVDLFADQSDTESDDELSFGRALEPMGIRVRLATDTRAAAPAVERDEVPMSSIPSPPPGDRRLAVPDRTDGTEYTLYNQLHAIRGAPMRGVVPFEQLWNLLLANQPFPPNANTVDSFIAALNASSWHDTPIAAPDLFALLREIIRCDPDVLSRADEASRARTRASRPPASPQQRSSRQHFGWLTQPSAHSFGPRSIRPLNSNPYSFRAPAAGRPAPEDESRRDGIWRTTFVEHIGDGQARDVEVDFDAGESAAEAFSFAAFAQQRRAERRQDAPEVGARAAAVEAERSMSSAAGEAPQVAVTSASTPETSQARSPPAAPTAGEAACPAPAAARRTSAAIAEAHARSQRRVVPLRSGASSDADLALAVPSAAVPAVPAAPASVEPLGAELSGGESMRAVVEALHRARSRRVRSTAPEATHGGTGVAAGGDGEEEDDALVTMQMR